MLVESIKMLHLSILHVLFRDQTWKTDFDLLKLYLDLYGIET